MRIIHLLIWILFLGSQCLCNSYLNNMQVSYIRNILTNPNTQVEIRKKMQIILFTNYYPWLNKQIQTFKIHNMNSLNCIMELELHQYAIKGFLKAINNFDGNSSLIEYADKYINRKMYIGIRKIMPNRILLDSKNDNNIIKDYEKINLTKSIVLSILPEQQKLLFSHYDFHTLIKIKSIYRICRMFQMSDPMYRKKMNVIKKYIRYRLRKMIF